MIWWIIDALRLISKVSYAPLSLYSVLYTVHVRYNQNQQQELQDRGARVDVLAVVDEPLLDAVALPLGLDARQADVAAERVAELHRAEPVQTEVPVEVAPVGYLFSDYIVENWLKRWKIPVSNKGKGHWALQVAVAAAAAVVAAAVWRAPPPFVTASDWSDRGLKGKKRK